MAPNGPQRLEVLPHLAIEVLPGRQLRKGGAEVAPRRAVKAALTATALPWSEDGQGDDLTPTEGSLRPRVVLRGQGERAKVIDHTV